MDYSVSNQLRSNGVESNSRLSNQVGSQGNQFSSDTFYKLLAAQLQYQDPMESMDNTQMILQMAQFATIEQLNNMNNQLAMFTEMTTIQSSANMIGKDVTIAVDNEKTIEGTITKVGFTSQGVVVEVDGKYYEIWRVIEFRDPNAPEIEKPEVEETPDVGEKPGVDETPEVGEKPDVEETPGVDETPGDTE
ncbi:MAG: flagellar hook capping FlgD N-terminal domain-containing protein [Turicibacter sp.]